MEVCAGLQTSENTRVQEEKLLCDLTEKMIMDDFCLFYRHHLWNQKLKYLMVNEKLGEHVGQFVEKDGQNEGVLVPVRP